MFAFNDRLDKYALKPVAKGYEKVVPSPVRTCVHNFFGNFSDAWSAVNQLLQGKFDNTAAMTMRVLTNSIIGLGGLLDPASEMGLERKPEDLGQTLGWYGVPRARTWCCRCSALRTCATPWPCRATNTWAPRCCSPR